jgi:hypothetical protein
MATCDDIQVIVKVAQFESVSGGPLVRYADLDGGAATVGAGVEGRLAVEAHATTSTLIAQGREYFNQWREPLTLLEERSSASCGLAPDRLTGSL